MKTRTRVLEPIRIKPSYFDEIEDVIRTALRKEIYAPLIIELGEDHEEILQNAMEDLVQAVASGQIQYVGAHFEGNFNASISRELRKLGAAFDRKRGWYRLPSNQLPDDLRSAIGASHSRFKAMAAKVDKCLADVVPAEVAKKMSISKVLDQAVYRVNADFEDSVKGIAVAPKLTEYQRHRIAAEYTNNLVLHIEDWTQAEIAKLRNRVQAQAQSGGRYEGLVKTIRDSYGASQSKAKFLARQETSLLMTKFKQTRYQQAGINEYIWTCVAGSAAHPVRPMHKALDGLTFRWDKPPVVDIHGHRKNPGQDFNCRCVARPIIKF
jgi:SPP1 gp7 family putative phage head morphogenesis protein